MNQNNTLQNNNSSILNQLEISELNSILLEIANLKLR